VVRDLYVFMKVYIRKSVRSVYTRKRMRISVETHN
jgi:hypothetical protein